jgi:hypothetical protein
MNVPTARISRDIQFLLMPICLCPLARRLRMPIFSHQCFGGRSCCQLAPHLRVPIFSHQCFGGRSCCQLARHLRVPVVSHTNLLGPNMGPVGSTSPCACCLSHQSLGAEHGASWLDVSVCLLSLTPERIYLLLNSDDFI